MTVPRLCLIADGFASGRPELDAATLQNRALDAVAAGVPWVALRDRPASDAAFLMAAGRFAERLRALRPDVVLSVHGRLGAARRLGAIYHATHGAPSVAEARAAGHEVAGASVHSATQAVVAARAGAAYVFFSPVFETRSHLDTPPAGIDPLRLAVERSGVPVLALGGMTPPRARIARLVGAHGAAAISGLLFAWDPATTVPQFLKSVGQ